MRLQHALLALLLCLSSGAQAAHHRYSRGGHLHSWVVQVASEDGGSRPDARTARIGYQRAYPRPREPYSDARPHAWCGWWMRHEVGRDPGPQFNLARSWASYGAAASGPAPGVIGVLPHHVFKVVAVLARGFVLAISGNDGHAVRTRPRSTAGVIAWRRA